MQRLWISSMQTIKPIKIMNILTNIGCHLIGWNKDILKECGEASHRQFLKLISAVSIMMLLWGTIGYCLAEKYINIESDVIKVCVSLAFVFTVLCIERIIILNVGKARLMSTMRVLLALCMAFLGSCIFDQMFFANDIKQMIQEHREDVKLEMINKQMSIYENDERRIERDMDSLSLSTIAINERLQKNPTIDITDVTTDTKIVGRDENGKPIYEKSTIVNRRKMPNPQVAQLNANNEQILLYQKQLEEIRQDKKDISIKINEEVDSRPLGFIEELEATVKVVSNSCASLVFYVILFCFLTFLELLVLTTKMGESKCDYELIVEHQLSLKKSLLAQTEKGIMIGK